MFTAAMHLPLGLTPSPIQTRWDELFLPATRIKVAGARVEELDRFDEADLHVETTTIMFADVVESVRLIEHDEMASVAKLRGLLRDIATGAIASCGGTVIERRGDGLLAKFPDARSATACAFAIHAFAHANSTSVNDGPIQFRIGIHSANVLSDSRELFGHGVNVTARIAALAEPSQTVISDVSRAQLTPGVDATIEDLGATDLKNVQQPIRIFCVHRLDTKDLAGPVISHDSALRAKLVVVPLAGHAAGGGGSRVWRSAG